MNRMRTWSIRRQTMRRSEAQRGAARRSEAQTRWDHAYQHLLQWRANREGADEAPRALEQETTDAHCPLRPGLDQPTSPGATDRTATGAAAGPPRQPRR